MSSFSTIYLMYKITISPSEASNSNKCELFLVRTKSEPGASGQVPCNELWPGQAFNVPLVYNFSLLTSFSTSLSQIITIFRSTCYSCPMSNNWRHVKLVKSKEMSRV